MELKQPQLLGLDNQELSRLAQELGQPAYRGNQLFAALYRQRVSGLDEITTLSRDFRQRLRNRFGLGLPEIGSQFISVDGTTRYLMVLGDKESVEAVWMPDGDGGDAGDTLAAEPDLIGSSSQPGNCAEPGAILSDEMAGGPPLGGAFSAQGRMTIESDAVKRFDRATICVSSQVGCAVNCQFCLTALLGVKRNLKAGEIVGQVIAILNERSVELNRLRINLVFMGMGEPFLNYEEFMRAVRLLVEGVGIPEPRMTVSTAGIVPRILDFGREAVRPKLAISLNAPNDDLRSRLMPINRKWNLDQLMGAARSFPLRPRERLTFEYVLLAGVNDALENAREVVAMLRGMRCKVNLIALNPGPEIPFRTPTDDHVQQFRQVLLDAGVPAFVRRPRGRDIYAACGQLKKASV